MSESLLFLGVGGHRFQNPFLLRELSGFQLGINQVAIDRDLEATPARRNQFQIANLLLVRGQQLARQTDGLRLIVSNRTILKLQMHDQLLLVPDKCDKVKTGASLVWRLSWNYINMVSAKDGAIKGGRIARLALGFPLTVIVRDRRENPKKCSILPLRDRVDLIILPYSVHLDHDLTGYVRLAPEGPELSLADASSGLLLLDGSWRRAEAMTRTYQHVSPRSLTGYRTAYPRVSKKGTDPAQGLATVEALFLAYHILGRHTAGLLDHYRWADEFLRLNNLALVRK